MRIEINSGGLSTGAALIDFQTRLNLLIDRSRIMISSLETIKKFTYTMNGGVGILEGAVGGLESRIRQEEDKYSNLTQAKQKTEDFIEFTRKVDGIVADMVNKNKEEFYRVNPWSNPAFSLSASSILGAAKDWLSKGMQWLGGFGVVAEPMGFGPSSWLTTLLFGAGAGLAVGLFDSDKTITVTRAGKTGEVKDGKASGSLQSITYEEKGSFLGFDSSTKAVVERFGGSAKAKSGAAWNIKEGNASATASAEAEAHIAKGSLSRNIGILKAKVDGSVGNVGAKGEVGAVLFKKGYFAPSLGAGVYADANVAKGSLEESVGNDQFDFHIGANGSVLAAKAKAEANIGVIEFEDTQGKRKTAIGAGAQVGAEAYLAEGTVSQGFKLFGIKFDVGLSGKLGGAGAKAGAQVTTKNITGEADLGLGVGLGLKFNVDWSDAVNPFKGLIENPPEVFVDALDFVSDIGTSTLDLADDINRSTFDFAGGIGRSTIDLFTGRSNPLEFVSDVGSTAIDFVGDVGSSAIDFVGDVGSTAIDYVTDIGRGAMDIIDDIGSSDWMPWNWF